MSDTRSETEAEVEPGPALAVNTSVAAAVAGMKRKTSDDSDSDELATARAAAKASRARQLAQQQERSPHTPDAAVGAGVPPRSAYPPITGCRSVYMYERLNHIEEGSYGVVFRARNKETGEIVAIKKLKMDKETNGFPITSLREIRTLMEARHPHVVQVKEIVVGDTLTQ